MVWDNETDKTIDMMTAPQRTILVLDPAGKLKLARWRLQSDGHRVSYMQDFSLVEPFIKHEQMNLVLMNIDDDSDLELVERVRSSGSHVKIVAVTADTSSRFRRLLWSKGIRSTVLRPVDYPKLSAVVMEELSRAHAQKPGKNALGFFKRRICIPINFLKIFSSYRAVLDQIKTAIMVLDHAGHIKFANGAMGALLRAEEDTLLNRHFKEVLKNPVYGSLLLILEHSFTTFEVKRNNEVIFNFNGEPMPCEAEAYPVFDQHGEFAGVFLLVDDVSNPKRLEQVMAQSEKLALVGQLAAGAAHEIRNPLTSVRGFIQLLKNELQGTPKIEYIDIIIKEIDRVNTIINEFLKLAKPAAPKRRPTNIRELVEDVHLLVEGEAFLNNITVHNDFTDNLPDVMVDDEQIKQVLINVIRNAFEAMAEGGTLTIKAYEMPLERRVCLEITDTGVGIDGNNVRRIFEPFFTTKDNGTGLGLAVSSEIIKSHGGTLDIKSKLGHGTTVYLCLPYE